MKKLLILSVLVIGFLSCSKDDSDSNDGIAFFISKDSLSSASSSMTIVSTPFIKYSDIVSYDTTNHIFELTFPADSILSKSKGYNNRSFVVKVNDTRIYYGVVWSASHSATNANLCLTEPIGNNASKNCIFISKGYPNNYRGFSGTDSRNDSKIIERLKKDNKLKN
jgi:hypothetical protein